MKEEWQEIKDRLMNTMDLSRDITDEDLKQLISEEVGHYSRDHLLSLKERSELSGQIYNSLRRLDVLQELLDDDEITEIMINGPEHIFFEKQGEIRQWEKGTLTSEKLSDVIQQIVGSANRAVNEASPIVDTRLTDGSRVNVVLNPIAIDGSVISIRKFAKDPITLEKLVEMHSISREVAEFLILLVRAGYNIFLSGGTSSGKTTFLNALSEYIPSTQRVITIEDSAELQLNGIPNLVRLETRDKNSSLAAPVTIRDLIKTSLRLRPDRIIVGEVRGPEALDMLQSFNTGHDGSMSSAHANSNADMLMRLETMILMAMDLPMEAIRRQIASGIDILVHLGRLRDRSRKVLQISEITGIQNGAIQLQTLYRFVETEERGGVIHGFWKKEGELEHVAKLQTEGQQEAYETFLAKQKK